MPSLFLMRIARLCAARPPRPTALRSSTAGRRQRSRLSAYKALRNGLLWKNSELRAVYVRAEYGGIGIGSAILGRLESLAREAGLAERR
jgi:GNAT superfamily N-acetyltransferase